MGIVEWDGFKDAERFTRGHERVGSYSYIVLYMWKELRLEIDV
jgi:hypothetical protein